jgi:hypothetical protein
MKQRLPKQPSETPSLAEMLFHSNLQHVSQAVSLFLLFSVADVVLTVALLYRGGFAESNPVARFFLNSWGPKGLVYFKVSLVATVCLIAQFIAFKRIETARRLLSFAALAVAVVVAYSLVLYYRAAM